MMSKAINLEDLPSPEDLMSNSKLSDSDSIDHLPSPKELTDLQVTPEVSSLEAGLRGAVQGGTLGFSDEALGALKAGVHAPFSDKKLTELYQEYRDLERAKNKLAEEQHPYLYKGGELAGGIGTAFVPGLGVARGAGALGTVAKTAALGGLAGAGGSQADLLKSSPEDINQLQQDVTLGTALGAAGGVAGKAVEGLAETPVAQKAIKYFTAGRKGTPLSGEAGEQYISGKMNELRKLGPESAEELSGVVGQEVGKTKEALSGKQADLGDFLKDEISKIEDKYTKSSSRSKAELDELLQPLKQKYSELQEKGKLDFDDLNTLKEDIAGLTRLEGDKSFVINKGKPEQLVSNINSVIENQFPQLSKINKQYSIAKGPQEFLNEMSGPGYTGGMNKDVAGALKANKFEQGIEQLAGEGSGARSQGRMLENTDTQGNPIGFGASVDKANKSLSSLIDEMRTSDPEKAAQLESLMGNLTEFKSKAPEVAEEFGLKEGLKKGEGLGHGSLLKTFANRGAYNLGKTPVLGAVAQNALNPTAIKGAGIAVTDAMMSNGKVDTSKLSKSVYDMNPDDLTDIANKMMGDKDVSSYGHALGNAVKENNEYRKNAVLFSILQNPKARKLIVGDQNEQQ